MHCAAARGRILDDPTSRAVSRQAVASAGASVRLRCLACRPDTTIHGQEPRVAPGAARHGAQFLRYVATERAARPARPVRNRRARGGGFVTPEDRDAWNRALWNFGALTPLGWGTPAASRWLCTRERKTSTTMPRCRCARAPAAITSPPTTPGTNGSRSAECRSPRGRIPDVPRSSVDRYLTAAPSCGWRISPASLRDAFLAQMRGRRYGPEAIMDAWIWFREGWYAKHRDDQGEDS